jgi:hypothetical protein
MDMCLFVCLFLWLKNAFGWVGNILCPVPAFSQRFSTPPVSSDALYCIDYSKIPAPKSRVANDLSCVRFQMIYDHELGNDRIDPCAAQTEDRFMKELTLSWHGGNSFSEGRNGLCALWSSARHRFPIRGLSFQSSRFAISRQVQVDILQDFVRSTNSQPINETSQERSPSTWIFES